MNEYEFEYELADGWRSIYYTFAACKLAAYEDFISFLKECNENVEEARVLNVSIVFMEDV